MQTSSSWVGGGCGVAGSAKGGELQTWLKFELGLELHPRGGVGPGRGRQGGETEGANAWTQAWRDDRLSCPQRGSMTDHPLGQIKLALKDGDEPFTQAGESKGFDLLEFWRWSTSDLVDNATRGVLAEYIVAKALKIETLRPRQSWAPWDLTWNAPGAAMIKLEVKSAAYSKAGVLINFRML